MSSLPSTITSYLPQHTGFLPWWLLILSVTAIGNSIQCYLTMSFTKRVYLGPKPPPQPQTSSSKPAEAYPSAHAIKYGHYSPARPLSSRTFGTWTMIQSIVRLYAAYHISNPQMYQLAYWTYVVAFGHFMSEWWYFKTARWGEGLAGPVIVAPVSLVWMWMQWGYYVR